MTKKPCKVNIDGDIIRYSVGFATEGEPIEFVIYTVNKMIDDIVEATKVDDYCVLLTGKGNYREEIATLKPYKGQRSKDKPFTFDEITEHLLFEHNGWICHGEEADDQLGIRSVQHGDVIATIDKDLDNVPGIHYNWRTHRLYEVSEQEAMHNFYMQMLVGDRVDNIPGLYYLTKRRATKGIKEKLLKCTSLTECYNHVFNTYLGDTGDSQVVQGWLTELGQLLWIRHKEGELWEPPGETGGRS